MYIEGSMVCLKSGCSGPKRGAFFDVCKTDILLLFVWVLLFFFSVYFGLCSFIFYQCTILCLM